MRFGKVSIKDYGRFKKGWNEDDCLSDSKRDAITNRLYHEYVNKANLQMSLHEIFGDDFEITQFFYKECEATVQTSGYHQHWRFSIYWKKWPYRKTYKSNNNATHVARRKENAKNRKHVW